MGPDLNPGIVMAVDYPHNCDRHNHHYWYPCRDCEREHDEEVRHREQELQLLEDIRWELQEQARADPPPASRGGSPAARAKPAAAPPLSPGRAALVDGGHLLHKHVGVSPEAAWDGRGPKTQLVSCFTGERIAEGVLGKMVADHHELISQWRSSRSRRPLVLTQRFPFIVGYAMVGPESRVPAYRARIVLKADPPTRSGYRIWNGYPLI